MKKLTLHFVCNGRQLMHCNYLPCDSGGERAAVQTLRAEAQDLASAKRLDCGGFSTALRGGLNGRPAIHRSFAALVVSILLAFASAVAAQSPASATTTANGLIERLLLKHAKQFAVETILADNGSDVFEIESRDSKVVLRGNNGVSVASALNWYLKEICHAHISWDCGDQLNLPKRLPVVPEKIRVVSPHKFRFAFNYCTHGYTMAWWDWERWERELDVLSLNGVNLALTIQGQEAVWINTLKEFGYTEDELLAWLVLPTHQPWMYMSNMQNYGGPLSRSLMAKRVDLAQKIIRRMRDLGMNPVLQGYYGIVPSGFQQRHAEAKIHLQGNWGDLKRPDMLEPTDPLFAKIAAKFYEEQTKLFGKAEFLAADPFHEDGSTDGVDLPACGRAIHGAMSGATWVLQSWQANPRQEMIEVLAKDKLLVLDLWCEAQDNWRTRNNFNGTPWLFCTINNFGGNVGLGGRLAWAGDGPVGALNDAAKGRMSGVGALLEGSGTNPAFWERFFENSWRTTAAPLDAWTKDYARRRYGAVIPSVEQAWQILSETIYNAPQSRRELPVNSVVCARPSLELDLKARAFVTTLPYYDTTRIVEAWRLLLAAAPQAKASDGYRYDLADVGRQVLADLATRYHQQMVEAYRVKDAVKLRALSDKMLGLIRDMDELTGTRREFLLGIWLADARRWGANRAEADRFECDARELITTWTSSDSIPDYANRQWSGLLGDFYLQRWEMWLTALNQSLANGTALDVEAVRDQIRDWELAWNKRTDRFPTKPKGDGVAISRKLFAKYQAASTPEEIEVVRLSAGGWTPDVTSTERIEWRLDVTPLITSSGDWTVTFSYTSGQSALQLESVSLVRDGVTLATDAHEGWTGAQHNGNAYHLSVAGLTPGGRLELRAQVRAVSSTNSAGTITVTRKQNYSTHSNQ